VKHFFNIFLKLRLAMMIHVLPSNVTISPKDIKFRDKKYTYKSLVRLKKELNEIKNNLFNEIIPGIPDGKREHNDVTISMDLYRGLKGELKPLGAQHVTNAWLKIYEILCIFMHTPYIEEDFRSFHIAEAPGAFLCAIDHYISSRKPNADWTWMAQTLDTDKDEALKDSFGIIRDNPENWVIVDTGDITKSNIVIDTCGEVKDKIGYVDFVTSDAKGSVNDYDEEEVEQRPLLLGSIIGALLSLKKGGTAVIKIFNCFDTFSVNILAILSCIFETIYIVKPVTSKPWNAEKYLVCQRYKKLNEYVGPLMKVFRTVNKRPNTPILTGNAIPLSFITAVIDMEKEFVRNEMTSLREIIRWMMIRKRSTHEEAKSCAVKWRNMYRVTKVSERFL
jgi:23S rRNA U2552 (ribose-2'-O)-methylase RlmE/FtsJ